MMSAALAPHLTTAGKVQDVSPPLTPTPTLTLRQRLRTQTAIAHERIERVPLLVALASGSIDLQRYTQYLRRMQVFHRALDDALRCQLPPGYLHAGLNQSAALDRDLAALNTPSGHLPAALAQATRALVGSHAAAWGVLYVLEGARLGSQVLLKRNANNAIVRQADTYVRGEAGATGRSWQAFCAALESGVTPAEIGILLAAAEQTFELLRHWLNASHD